MRAYYESGNSCSSWTEFKNQMLIHYFSNGQAVPILKVLVVTGWHLDSLYKMVCFAQNMWIVLPISQGEQQAFELDLYSDI